MVGKKEVDARQGGFFDINQCLSIYMSVIIMKWKCLFLDSLFSLSI